MNASKIAAYLAVFVLGGGSVVAGLYAAGLDPLARLEIVVEEAPPPPVEGLTDRQTVEAIRQTVRREIRAVMPNAVEDQVLAAVEARVSAAVRSSIEETLRTTVREIVREELAALRGETGQTETDQTETDTGQTETETETGQTETDETETETGQTETDETETETGQTETETDQTETDAGQTETETDQTETGQTETETEQTETETEIDQTQSGQTETGTDEDPFAGGFRPPGDLHPRSAAGGTSRGYEGDFEVVGMRFPLEASPAYANSQVFGVGGFRGPRGGQCDPRNYSYPWRDNFCEARRFSTSFCPGGRGHQGQDIRPATCEDDTHWAVATENGRITGVGTWTVTLMGESGHEYRYLHLSMDRLAVRRGQAVQRGQRLGLVSNDFGGTPTTYHLHFEIRRVVRDSSGRVRRQVMPVYLSLVNSYRRLLLEEKAARAEQ